MNFLFIRTRMFLSEDRGSPGLHQLKAIKLVASFRMSLLIQSYEARIRILICSGKKVRNGGPFEAEYNNLPTSVGNIEVTGSSRLMAAGW